MYDKGVILLGLKQLDYAYNYVEVGLLREQLQTYTWNTLTECSHTSMHSVIYC